MRLTGKIIFFLILVLFSTSLILGLDGLNSPYSKNSSYAYSADISNIIINPAKINNKKNDQLSFLYEFDNSLSNNGIQLSYIFKNPDSNIGSAIGINYAPFKDRSDIYLSLSYEVLNSLSIG